jgi:hypothetical protein
MQAIAMGARASGRSSWLIAPGLLVAFLRAALGWPLPFFALAIAGAGVSSRLQQDPSLHPIAIVAAAIEALTAPRSIFTLAGLWVAGILIAAVLRVAWMAGALPALGAHLTRTPRAESGFAEGVAFGFTPMLGTAALGLVVELIAQIYSWCVYLAAALVALRGGGGQPTLAGLLAAAALTTAVAAPIFASLVADAALARNALSGDAPTRALLVGARRVAVRPGAFVLAAFVLGVAGMVILGAAETMETAVLGVAGGAPYWLALGPRLMATTIAAALATLLELWRLGTIAALACGDEE